jgi:hypothetical protein
MILPKILSAGKYNGSNLFYVGLLLAVILIGYYSPWLFQAKTFYFSDLTYYFEPLIHFINNSDNKELIPLWNPFTHCGMSQIAIPSPNILYPVMLVFKLLPFSQALAVFMIIHQVIAGLGTYLFINSLGFGRWAAVISAIAFSLSGYMFSLTYNFTLPATASWLPTSLFLIDKIKLPFNLTTIKWIAFTAISICMLCLAGRPELSVPAVMLSAIYSLLNKSTYKTIFLKLLAIIAGLIIASPVILPAIEWARLSPRAHGLDLQYVFLWSVNWYDCLSIIVSQPLGNLSVLGSKFLPLVAARHGSLPYVESAFIGPTIFTLAIWGITDKNWKHRYLVLIAFALSLLMALGNNTFFAPFIVKLSPYLATFRYPIKLIIFPIFFLVIMAARGINVACDKNVSLSGQIISILFWSLSFLFSIVLFTCPELYLLLENKSANPNTLAQAQNLLAIACTLSAAIGLITSALYFLLKKSKLSPHIFSAIICFGVIIQLIGSNYILHRPGNSNFFEIKNKAANEIQNLIQKDKEIHGQKNALFFHRFLPLYFDPLYCPPWLANEFNMPYEQAFFQYGRQLLLPNTHLGFNLPSSFGYEAAETGQYKDMFLQAYKTCSQNKKTESPKINDLPMANFCKITATKYILTQAFRKHAPIAKLDSKFFQLIEEDITHNTRLYICLNTYPRLYFAKNLEPITELANIGKNKIIQESPEEIKIETNCDDNAYLILLDQFYPGWKALIDNKETNIYKANFFARAVFVPKGIHTITFTYKPESFYIGIILTLSIICALIISIIYVRKSSNKVRLEKHE